MLGVRLVACAVVLCMTSLAFGTGIQPNSLDQAGQPQLDQLGPQAEVTSPTSSTDENPDDDSGQLPFFEEEEDSKKLYKSQDTGSALPPSGLRTLDTEPIFVPGIASSDLFRPPQAS